MLLAVIAVALGAAAGVVVGRRPPRHEELAPGRADLTLLATGVLTSLAGRGLNGSGSGAGTAVVLAVGGHALLVAFAVRNWRHPGMVVIAVGLLSNLAVIGADHGMPVSTLPAGITQGLHHGLTASDHLRGLADIIAVPGWGLTVSPGDLLLSLGGAIAAFSWLDPPRSEPHRGGRPDTELERGGPELGPRRGPRRGPDRRPARAGSQPGSNGS